MRKKLIELLTDTLHEWECDDVQPETVSQIAEHLIDNGVIVPPVKVGERRIDDLGRIHIPKDVRQSLSINYGDVMSINVSDASIILKKEREQE